MLNDDIIIKSLPVDWSYQGLYGLYCYRLYPSSKTMFYKTITFFCLNLIILINFV